MARLVRATLPAFFLVFALAACFAPRPAAAVAVERVESPGGAVGGSQELYSEIRRIRKRSGKPIIASMGYGLLWPT